MVLSKNARYLIILWACFAVQGATKTPSNISDNALDAATEMRPYIDRYIADRSSLMRAYSLDLSSARQDRMKQLYAEWLDRLVKVDFNSMSEPGKIDYLLLQNHLQHEVRQIALTAKNQADAASLVPFVQTILDLEESRQRMKPLDPAKTAGVLDALAKQVDAQRRSVEANLKAAQAKKTVANRAAVEVQTLRGTLKRWFDFYKGVSD